MAAHLRVSRSAIAQVESGDSKGFKPENLLRAAELLGVTPTTLQFGDAGLFKEVATHGVSAILAVDVPVIGTATASPDADGELTDGEFPPGAGESYVPWPTRDPNAYALRVRGDSMQPRIRPGELIVVEPNRAAEPGDDVLVKCVDGRRMVKQLLWKRGEAVALGSVNQAMPPKTISVAEIAELHPIAGIVPRGANVKEPPA